jgi:hypothetical protein
MPGAHHPRRALEWLVGPSREDAWWARSGSMRRLRRTLSQKRAAHKLVRVPGMVCPGCQTSNPHPAEACLECGENLRLAAAGAVLPGRYEILGRLAKAGWA